jgi:hypothetical protein
MHMNTKKEILTKHLAAWLACRGDRQRRGQMTQFISSTLQIHPKSVGRSFRAIQLGKRFARGPVGRRIYYGADTQAALYDVWNALSRICAENLFPVVQSTVSNMQLHGHWKHGDIATGKLLAMSLGTMKNRVGILMEKYEYPHGTSTTRSSPLKDLIPIFKGPWKDFPPGYGQIDTVAHCGGDIAGSYMFSTNYTDGYSYFVIIRAQWNKGEAATLESLEYIRNHLPFTLQGIHPDSGTEFINWTLKKWADRHSIAMTRSQPGKSNDNMYVEERNAHVIRKFVGYARYDSTVVVPLVNEYYACLELYINYCTPVRRLLRKERIGSKMKRTVESVGKTPYLRLLESEQIATEQKRVLQQVYQGIDILTLQQKLVSLKKAIGTCMRNHILPGELG